MTMVPAALSCQPLRWLSHGVEACTSSHQPTATHIHQARPDNAAACSLFANSGTSRMNASTSGAAGANGSAQRAMALSAIGGRELSWEMTWILRSFLPGVLPFHAVAAIVAASYNSTPKNKEAALYASASVNTLATKMVNVMIPKNKNAMNAMMAVIVRSMSLATSLALRLAGCALGSGDEGVGVLS